MERKQMSTKGLKSKLTAALCMLLVGVTLVVSATYAWVVLSTAPEVKGISTTVGANGALEIWLNESMGGEYTSSNLLNLSPAGDLNKYGLNEITLLPSKLNAVDGKMNAHFLNVPEYDVNGTHTGGFNGIKTQAGIWNGNEFVESDDTGVRGVGVASGLTDRQLAYREAKNAANRNMNTAKNTAENSLQENGGVLANIVIKRALDASATYTVADLESWAPVFGALKTATDAIDEAYKQMIIALAASEKAPTDTLYSIVKGQLEGGGLALADIALDEKITVGENSVSLAGTDLLAGLQAHEATKARLSSAESDRLVLIEQAAAAYTWEEVAPIVSVLINQNNVTLNGLAVTGENKDALKDSVVEKVAAGEHLQVVLGAGAYVEIAAQCGELNKNLMIPISGIEAIGFDVNLKANMKTQSGQTPAHLTLAWAVVEAAGYPESENGNSDLPMTEFYGYIVDLGFITNAQNSNLLLQTDPIDRIYKDNLLDSATAGAGSFMTYTVVNNALEESQVKQLMSCIRIVFFNPVANDDDTYTILGEARLGTVVPDEEAETYTAKMYMYKEGILQEGEDGDNVITSLGYNAETYVSALVYIDGKDITNKHVAAEEAASLVGQMNLQFASDADLKPMEYGDLHVPNGN